MSAKLILEKRSLSFFIFLFINFLFGIKYFSRLTDLYFILSAATIGIYFILWQKRSNLNALLKKINIPFSILLFLYFVVVIIVFKVIPKESLNVDRWSVITSFWDSFFDGKYVYLAKSFDNNYPGPMPLYFILALPFYLMGELGFFSLLGILLFVFLIRTDSQLKSNENVAFLLIGTSLFYIWEICSRSNIFTNGVLVLIALVYFLRKYRQTLQMNLIFGIILGLLLSTRNVFVIPIISLIIFSLKSKSIDFKNCFYLGLVAILTFCLTFVPFVWNHLEDFRLMNPFIIQSSFLMPFKYNVIFIIATVLISLTSKRKTDVYFYSGLMLFCTILFYFFYTISVSDFQATFYGSKADISYFILCLPFLIFYFLSDETSAS